MSSSPVPAEHWFLPDLPITDPRKDEFSHVDVARNLAEMVREKEPPSIIGLLGPFGVGKSTVVELLAGQIKGSADLDIIRVSAERHSEPAGLHRTLIYAVAEALQGKGLRRPHDLSDILRRVERSHELTSLQLTDVPLLRLVKAKRRALLQSLGLLVGGMALWIIGVVIVAAAFQHRHYAAALSSGFAVPLALLLAGLVAVGRLLGGLVVTPIQAALTPDTLTESRPRAEAADEFERVFSDLVCLDTKKAEPTKRLIIAIDDVDRLAPERLLETLHAIHSFQRACKDPRPVFIVSCDEMIVRDAIVAARPSLAARQHQLEAAATAYLDRLFLHRQYVVAHPPRDMRGYARDLLADGTHTGAARLGESLNEVIEVLVHDGVTDPRHAIRLLNAFFSDYRLAILRESGVGRRSLRAGEVTGHPRVLARVTVLKVDFPATYAAVLSDTDILIGLDKLARREGITKKERHLLSRYLSPRDLEKTVVVAPAADAAGEPDPVADEQIDDPPEPLEDVSSLLAYLSRTRDWFDDVESLLPFLYISQDEIDRRLGSGEARRIRGMLANGQTDLLTEHIGHLVSEDAEAHDTSGISGYIELVDDLLSGLSGIELGNARNAVVKTLTSVPEGKRGRLADRIGRFASDSGVHIEVDDAIAAAVASQDDESRRALFAVVLSAPSEADPWTDKALAVARHLPQLQGAGLPETDSTAFLLGAIRKAADSNSLNSLRKWITACTSEPEVIPLPVVERPLVQGYLKVVAAQGPGAEQPPDDDVSFVQAHVPTDADAVRQAYASARDIMNKQKLAGAFGRLAVAACPDASGLDTQTSANIVSALSRSALLDDGSIDDDIESGTLRRMVHLLCSLSPAAATYETTVGGSKVPTLAATVSLAATWVSSVEKLVQLPAGPGGEAAISADEARNLCLKLYVVLSGVRVDLVGPLTTALVARWQQELGSVPTAHEWLGPAITGVDQLPPADGDALLGAVVGTVQGRTRADPIALAALPTLRSFLSTASGVRALPALLTHLQGSLNAATPEVAVFAIDVIQLIYETAPADAISGHASALISSLNSLAALNQPNVSPDGIRGLTRIDWPCAHVNAAISAATQFTGQMTLDDLRGVISAIGRCGSDAEQLQPLAEPLATRLVEEVAGDTSDAELAAAVWTLLTDGARALAASIFQGLIDQKHQTLVDLPPDEQRQEVERWIRLVLNRAQGGATTPGAADSMRAVRMLPDSPATGTIGQIIEEWLSGATSVPGSLWPTLFTSLSETAREHVGDQLINALTTGRDRAVRSLEALAMWIPETEPQVVSRVFGVNDFPEWARSWILEQRDPEVAQALRLVVDALPNDLQRAIRERVGRRPRDEARPIWDAVFD